MNIKLNTNRSRIGGSEEERVAQGPVQSNLYLGDLLRKSGTRRSRTGNEEDSREVSREVSVDGADTCDSDICALFETSKIFIVGRLIARGGRATLDVRFLTLVCYTVSILKKPVYIAIFTSMFGELL